MWTRAKSVGMTVQVELWAKAFEEGVRGRTEEGSSESDPRRQSPRTIRPLALAALTILSLLAACETPGPPAVCGSLPQQTIVVGESATVTACFDDPGGNTLAYKVWTSDAGVVAVSGSGATVTVTAVSPGDAVVTILADNNGLKAQQSMSVLVPNRPPLAIGQIEDREVAVGDSSTVDVAAFFSEPDGQKLTYTAAADSSLLNASVAETILTVVAIAKGTATVTLTAMDPGGLNAVQSFLVLVPNRPPLAEGSVPERTVEVADSAMVDVSPFFSDPDGDALTYAAVASDTLVAAATVAESMITVTALAKGKAIIDVTATDTEGLKATQSFSVMVPNRPPLVMDSIPAQVVEVGHTEDLDMAPLFRDPDGDSLTYTAVSADRSVAWASVVGNSVSVLAVAKGATTIRVTATDTEDLEVAQTFAVTVPNQPPLVEGSVPPLTVRADSVFTIDASVHFSDPDGDSLTYAATTSDPTVAAVTATGSTVTVTAVSGGEASVTVTATDTEGAVATLVFPVTVPNRPPLATTDIAARRLDEGDTETLDLDRYFNDPDKDGLTFIATSSNKRVATAEVSGDELTVTAVQQGTTNVTVTASDPDGASASTRFRVVVARPDDGNRPPAPAAPIPDQQMALDGSQSRDLRNHFSDPDDDNLTFEASSSNEAVATTALSGSDLTVTAVAEGTASISVAAEDPGGLSTRISFDVTVGKTTNTPNRAPVLATQPPDRAIVKGAQWPIQGWRYFEDPDGDELTYSGSSSNPGVAGINQTNEFVFRVVGRSDGSATITITARDPDGLTSSADFTVKVGSAGNNAPTVKTEIGSLTSSPGQVDMFTLNRHFDDDDVGDELRLRVSSSNTAIVSVSVQNDGLYGIYAKVRGVAVGSATVTMTATDLGGLSASQSFTVTVERNRPPRATGSFDDILETTVGDTLTFLLSNYFADPDGDDLTYSATVGAAASVAVSGDTLHIIGKVADGASFGRVTATDSGGKSADLSFTVYVRPSSSQQDAGYGAQYAYAPGAGMRARGARSSTQ
ncbi:MAG: Ig-like domain-containing protein [Gemmatimonadota bacterium]|nr:Ig-like domain-containing protein [Gemmatimonadota bacterium]